MKITIQQSILSHHLDNAAKFLPKKEMIPILSHIVLSSTFEGLEIIAGNAETFIRSIIPASEYQTAQAGAIAIPGKELSEIVKKMSGEISIQSTSNESVSIFAGESEYELSALDAEEYPKFPEVTGTSLTIKGSDFKELIATTAYAVSTLENTPILMGILFSQHSGQLKLTACDRHRLAQIESENEGGEIQTVVAGQTLVELSKVIGEQELEICFSGALLVKSPDFTFYSRILEGTYPDTTKLIPQEFKTTITVGKRELLEALERILIIAKEGKTNTVKLLIDPDKMKIESKEQTKRAREGVAVPSFVGDKLTISVNGKFITDALKTITASEVEINFNGPVNPLIIKGKDEYATHLILPYRVAN